MKRKNLKKLYPNPEREEGQERLMLKPLSIKRKNTCPNIKSKRRLSKGNYQRPRRMLNPKHSSKGQLEDLERLLKEPTSNVLPVFSPAKRTQRTKLPSHPGREEDHPNIHSQQVLLIQGPPAQRRVGLPNIQRAFHLLQHQERKMVKLRGQLEDLDRVALMLRKRSNPMSMLVQ